MFTKFLSILILATFMLGCEPDNQYSGSSVEKEKIQDLNKIKSAELSRIGMLVVTNQDDQEIAVLRGVKDYQFTNTNLVIELQQQIHNQRATFHERQMDQKDRKVHIRNQIIYYDNLCQEIAEFTNILSYQIHQTGLAMLTDEDEFLFYDQNAQIVFSANDIFMFDITDQGIYLESLDKELFYFSLDGKYQVNLTNSIKRQLVAKGLIYLDQLGFLTYVSAQGEVIFEIENVNYFSVDEIEGEYFVTYYLSGRHRKIEERKL